MRTQDYTVLAHFSRSLSLFSNTQSSLLRDVILSVFWCLRLYFFVSACLYFCECLCVDRCAFPYALVSRGIGVLLSRATGLDIHPIHLESRGANVSCVFKRY